MNAFIFLSEDSSKTPILYLDNPQEVREFCKKNDIDLNSYTDANWDLTYAIEDSDYSVCISDITSKEFRNFLKDYCMNLWDVVDFITLSKKLNEFDLYISILYYSEDFIENILEEYPKALKRFIGALELNHSTESIKALADLVFKENINTDCINYINVDDILNDLDIVETENLSYLFNPNIQ